MTYDLPLVDPEDTGAPPEHLAGLAAVRTAGLRRWAVRGGRRRVAYVDTHFPWLQSGFRYDEASTLLRLRPDTLFFSLYELSDPFPAPVHRLADFPATAGAAGVTDVFCVFLNLGAGLLGNAARPEVTDVPGLRTDLSLRPALDRHQMRLHLALYPGGGLLPTTPPAVVLAATAGAATVFTSVRDLAERLPGLTPTEVPIDVDQWSSAPRERRPDERLRVVFVADDQPRKGLDSLLRAVALLPTSSLDLHVVGPHARHVAALASSGATVHGWLDPEPLRALLQTCHVVVSPSTRDRPEDGYGDPGMVDGFPTTASAIAMLAGCCLVASNPLHEHVRLVPDRDYLEVPERDPQALAAALSRLLDDDALRRVTALQGSATARAVWAAEPVVRRRLEHVGLL